MSNRRKALVLFLGWTGCAVVLAKPPDRVKDLAWFETHAQLIFHETFDREEDGNLAAALGNDLRK